MKWYAFLVLFLDKKWRCRERGEFIDKKQRVCEDSGGLYQMYRTDGSTIESVPVSDGVEYNNAGNYLQAVRCGNEIYFVGYSWSEFGLYYISLDNGTIHVTGISDVDYSYRYPIAPDDDTVVYFDTLNSEHVILKRETGGDE